MTGEAALRAAIIASPDDDTPRLALADWLDENRPDDRPSPATGPSARGEYIRVQSRLAAGVFDSPDYPKLLERERDLAHWLNAHDPEPDPQFEGLFCQGAFDSSEWGDFRRGFLEVINFEDYEDVAEDTVSRLVETLEEALPRTTARTLAMEEPTAAEIALLTRHPIFARLRGLHLDYLDGGDEDEAVAAIASSPKSAGLRRLYLDFQPAGAGYRALAASRSLGNLESLVIDTPSPAKGLKDLARAKWFRNLRRLGLWTANGDVFRVLADLPPLPRLVSLTLTGSIAAKPASIRRFAASDSFPRLAHLNLSGVRLSAESVELLARGEWPLRHLDLGQNEVRKAGAEALATAPFAGTLRVLELRECDVTAGGVQALADSPALAGLQHLDLSGNPVGPGGLAALAASEHLGGLRLLDLSHANTTRAPLAAKDVLAFLSSLDLPQLRHLALDGLPVGVRGARVLASSPSFAGLTRLRLEGCGMNSRATTALVASKTLTDLVSLDLYDNKVGSGVAKLADERVFPRLGYCRLGCGIPRSTAARLRHRPGMKTW